jgi:hypothetical protein
MIFNIQLYVNKLSHIVTVQNFQNARTCGTQYERSATHIMRLAHVIWLFFLVRHLYLINVWSV